MIAIVLQPPRAQQEESSHLGRPSELLQDEAERPLPLLGPEDPLRRLADRLEDPIAPGDLQPGTVRPGDVPAHRLDLDDPPLVIEDGVGLPREQPLLDPVGGRVLHRHAVGRLGEAADEAVDPFGPLRGTTSLTGRPSTASMSMWKYRLKAAFAKVKRNWRSQRVIRSCCDSTRLR